MQKVIERLADARPLSVRCAVLLWKKVRTEVPLRPDFHAFVIPDEFVVGYGLDYDERYRNLPYVGVLRKELLEQPNQ